MTSSPALEVFFDSACPLCRREIALLRRLDRRGAVGFVDIAASDFDASSVGVPFEALMARIHARLPDGTMIEGVDVFRRLYEAVGFGWLVSLTRLPLVAPALELAYGWFAKNRLRLTGRCDDATCST